MSAHERFYYFYSKLLELLFKFLITIFGSLVTVIAATIFYFMNLPMLYLPLFYVCYVCTIYGISHFKALKDLKENLELYLPKLNPQPHELYDIIMRSDVLTDEELNLLFEWCHGKTCRELKIHPNMLNRLLRKYVQHSLVKKNAE